MNRPEHPAETTASTNGDPQGVDDKLNQLLARINGLTTDGAGDPPPRQREPAPVQRTQPSQPAQAAPAPQPAAQRKPQPMPDYYESEVFTPTEPDTIESAGLTGSDVDSLILKYLLTCGEASGANICDQVCLPFRLIEPVLRQLKNDQLIGYKGSAAMNDYVCQLTQMGREHAKSLASQCTYFGAAPVALDEYIESVKLQSLEKQHPSEEALKAAFADLLINPNMLRRLGPAINSGRGMFLFGAPGNGKTSIAERVTSAFGETVWVPRALYLGGEIMRLFDPMSHELAPLPRNEGLCNDPRIDRRWVRIKRPTIIVGGELTMSNLEVSFNAQTGISEAPIQLKSNCGTLVIDDFGRQRMSIDELLNRWIVPLEKRYDFLNMSNGKKIQVPFDQLVVFSTNLEPRDLVDDAFLRRIPYKIEVTDPSEADFRKLFEIMCPLMGFEHKSEMVDYLIKKHYLPVERPFRCCQPRDLLQQVKNYCVYKRTSVELTEEYFDYAVDNYFAVM